MNQQLFEKALKSFEKAAKADPRMLSAQVNCGIALLSLGRAEEAKKILESVVNQDPKDSYAWFNLGLIAKNASDSQPAIEAFRHVTEIDPNDADAWYFQARFTPKARGFRRRSTRCSKP